MRIFASRSLPIPECEWNVRLGFADRLTAARYSKVVLYLERDLSNCSSHGRSLSPTKRLFETAALGVAQVAISDEATIGPYFEPGKEILLARSAEEAAGMIRELLADPARLEALGQAARKRVLSEHLYSHRARAILDHMADIPVRRPRKIKPQPLRLLMVAHGVRGQRPWGGTELHVDQLRKTLENKYDIHLLYTSPHRSGRSMVYRHAARAGSACCTRAPTTRSARGSIRSETPPSRSCWSKKRSTSSISSTSSSIRSVTSRWPGRWGGLPCWGCTTSSSPARSSTCWTVRAGSAICRRSETCDQCLAQMDGLPAGAQSRRRELLSQVCSAVDKIHFLSHSQRIADRAGLADSRGQGFRAGIGDPPRDFAARRRRSPPPPLRIAVLGNHARNKGADTLIAIVEQLASESIQFRIAGAIEEAYKARLEAIAPQLRRTAGSLRAGTGRGHSAGLPRGAVRIALAGNLPAHAFRGHARRCRARGPGPGGLRRARPRRGKRARRARGRRLLCPRACWPCWTIRRCWKGSGRAFARPASSRSTKTQRDSNNSTTGLAAEYGLPGDFVPRLARIRRITSPIVRPCRAGNPAAKSTLEKVMWIYKTQGAHAVLRRAWQRTSAWIRSATERGG